MYLGSWVHNNFVSAAIPKDVGILLALARSPRCRKVLRDTFNVIALKKVNLLNPKSGWEWRSFIDSVLEDKNNSKDSSDETLERIVDTLNHHCCQMETYSPGAAKVN